jgi:hypothetical protein
VDEENILKWHSFICDSIAAPISCTKYFPTYPRPSQRVYSACIPRNRAGSSTTGRGGYRVVWGSPHIRRTLPKAVGEEPCTQGPGLRWGDERPTGCEARRGSSRLAEQTIWRVAVKLAGRRQDKPKTPVARRDVSPTYSPDYRLD